MRKTSVPANFGRKPRATTHVALILDRSGSMAAIRQEVVSGYNEQIDQLRAWAKKGQDIRVTLVTFNDQTTTHYFDLPIDEIDYIKDFEYQPSGMTAMYDAVGSTLTRLKALPEGPSSAFLVVTLSDGMENSSRRYSSSTIAEMVQTLQKTECWTFSYIGANQDLVEVQAAIGIPTVQFANDSIGTKRLFAANARTVGVYFSARACGQTVMANYADTLDSNLVDSA